MSKLSVPERRGLKAASFALPKARTDKGGAGGWPMPDKSHARFALTQVGRSESKGNVSSGQAAVIRARANSKLGKSP
jgi:hypothetical protein